MNWHTKSSINPYRNSRNITYSNRSGFLIWVCAEDLHEKNTFTEIDFRGNKMKNKPTEEIVIKNFCITWYLALKK